jgi:hypothetical protein
MALPLTFGVPMFPISGRRDHFTPADLADNYLNSIAAPAKPSFRIRWVANDIKVVPTSREGASVTAREAASKQSLSDARECSFELASWS